MKHIWDTKTTSNPGISQAGGTTVYSYPLLLVSPPREMPVPPKADDTLVFTSKNGVRAFCELTQRRNWPALCVGDTTAKWAEAAGFKHVQSANGDVIALQNMIASQNALQSERLYYASGRDISADLAGDLDREGYKVFRSILYETHPIRTIPEPLRTAMSQISPFYVALYSSKAARVFATLNLNFARLNTVSISENVDRELKDLRLNDRTVANAPTELGMIKLLS